LLKILIKKLSLHLLAIATIKKITTLKNNFSFLLSAIAVIGGVFWFSRAVGFSMFFLRCW
jgi:hypothetical protein